jgi:hypothetical protein
MFTQVKAQMDMTVDHHDDHKISVAFCLVNMK